MVGRRLLVVTVILIAALHATGGRAAILIGVAGPMTGKDAWFGEQLQRGAQLAVADINAGGGVLGQQVRLISADDFCDPEQAVAAAQKLVSEGVIFVVGHFCSHASIPASKVYEAAGVLMISPSSSNPLLTELGRANVFRVTHRDDAPVSRPATTWPIIGPTKRSRSFTTTRLLAGDLPKRQKSS
jgi:branched-chain amino acid transport system substrate-binding protein